MGFFLLLGNSLTHPKGSMDLDKKLDNCATGALLFCSLSLWNNYKNTEHKKYSLQIKKNVAPFQEVGEGDINARRYKALSLCNALIM